MSTTHPLRGQKGYIKSHLETGHIWVKGLKFDSKDNGDYWYRIIYDRSRIYPNEEDNTFFQQSKADVIQTMLEEHFEGYNIEVIPDSMDWLSTPMKYRVKARLKLTKRKF